jgi:hypothetical protein
VDLYPADRDAKPLQPRSLTNEAELHSFVEQQSGLELGGLDLFIIDSEGSTRTGVRPDILGLTETGHLVVVELKQAGGGRSGARTALVQALEYAADFRAASYSRLAETHADYAGSDQSLREAHAAYFDLTEPLAESAFTMAVEPRLVLLAESFEASDIDAARYLRDANDVDITCVAVTPFAAGDGRLYAFECRLESKTSPNRVDRETTETALPWLTRRLEEAYYDRFGDRFGIESVDAATEREAEYKSHRFVSAEGHPDALRYTFQVNAFDEKPDIDYGVSPDGHEAIEQIVDRNAAALGDDHELVDRNWRRIRPVETPGLESVLADAQIDVVSPVVDETVGRVLWNDDEFQRIWTEFLDLVETWHTIIDAEFGPEGATEKMGSES